MYFSLYQLTALSMGTIWTWNYWTQTLPVKTCCFTCDSPSCGPSHCLPDSAWDGQGFPKHTSEYLHSVSIFLLGNLPCSHLRCPLFLQGQGFVSASQVRRMIAEGHQGSLSPLHPPPWGKGWDETEMGKEHLREGQDHAHCRKPGSDSSSEVKLLHFNTFYFLYFLFQTK